MKHTIEIGTSTVSHSSPLIVTSWQYKLKNSADSHNFVCRPTKKKQGMIWIIANTPQIRKVKLHVGDYTGCCVMSNPWGGRPTGPTFDFIFFYRPSLFYGALEMGNIYKKYGHPKIYLQDDSCVRVCVRACVRAGPCACLFIFWSYMYFFVWCSHPYCLMNLLYVWFLPVSMGYRPSLGEFPWRWVICIF